MPSALHPSLKRGLDFDASPIHPRDLLEDLPADHHDEAHETAKRRRVEAIALQCLRGRPPLILTAQLKGPFTNGWKNPWAKDTEARPDVQSKSIAERVEGQERKRTRTSQVASPEASRAARCTEDDLYSQAELEPLPATAPIPDDDEPSDGTEFFSVDTEQFIANISPANPFWLRRPAAPITYPSNSQIDKSPIKVRKREERFDRRKSLQLAAPKEPLGRRPMPIRPTPPEEWRSSASAPMDITSRVGVVPLLQQISEESVLHTMLSADAPDSSRLREDSVQSEEARSSQVAQQTQATIIAATLGVPKDSSVSASATLPAHAQSFDSLVPATTYKDPSIIQVPQSSPLHRSAERFAGRVVRSASELPLSPIRRKSTKISPSKKLRHDLVASPAPASSTGFVYRRVGQPKGDNTTVSKIKPRAVNFSSSSSLKKMEHVQSDQGTKGDTTVTEPQPSGGELPSATEEQASQVNQSSEGDEEKERDDQQESYNSKQSQYSTQAAMLLAQLEFQEDATQSSTSSATLRPWSQPAQNTPPPLLAQPSPAITPLSVFNTHTDVAFNDLAGDSVLHGPSVSTQDLFAAASPFAFSTVKKKSERPRRTSLRFALTSNSSGNLNAKCPASCAERVPLKEKNTPTSWSFVHDKVSPEPLKADSQHIPHDVGLPQLDFHTSLDFGPTTDFTDCFLRGLDNESR